MEPTYKYLQYTKDFHSQLFIQVIIPNMPIILEIVCTSTSRDSTDYELFDETGKSMGDRTFSCQYGNIAYPRFNRALIEDLNVLLKEHKIQLSTDNFKEISKLAVGKCESRYGYSIEGGDCIITISGEEQWNPKMPPKNNSN